MNYSISFTTVKNYLNLDLLIYSFDAQLIKEFSFILFADNVASLAMGKTARRSIDELPSSPSSSPYPYKNSKEQTSVTHQQFWSHYDFQVATPAISATSRPEALRWVKDSNLYLINCNFYEKEINKKNKKFVEPHTLYKFPI